MIYAKRLMNMIRVFPDGPDREEAMREYLPYVAGVRKTESAMMVVFEDSVIVFGKHGTMITELDEDCTPPDDFLNELYKRYPEFYEDEK